MSAPAKASAWSCEGPYCVPDGKGGADCSSCPLCNEPDDDDRWDGYVWDAVEALAAEAGQ